MSNITNTRKEEDRRKVLKFKASCKTPEGYVSYPKLNQPDEYMGNKQYKADLRLDPKNPEVAEFITEYEAWSDKVKVLQRSNLQEAIDKLPANSARPADKKNKAKLEGMLEDIDGENYKSLIEDEYDSEGQLTGYKVIKKKIKMNAEGTDSEGRPYTMEPKIYTATGRVPLAEAPQITAGSTLRFNLDISTYEMSSSGYVGITARLKDVLIVKIGQGGDAGGSNPFGGDTAYQPETFDSTPASVGGSDDEEGY